MYNLTEAAIEAFKLRRASIQIPVDLLSGDDIPALTEKDLKSVTLERIGVSGKTIEIGAARVYELKLRLKNTYGEFDGISFDGARIFPRIIAGQYTCPLGYFTIDGHEKGTGYIELTALDRMVLFDKVATYEQVAFPITVKNLVFAACYACGVDSSRLDIDELPNADYSVQNAPEDDTTWRQIIMWCGELMGVNSYMDAEGYFCMAWCNQTQLRITASDRYTHKLFENDVTVAGVEVIDNENEVTYLAGSDSGYKFTIDGNELLTHDHESVASALGAKLVGFSYRPFTATTLSMPNIFPYDIMTYIEPNGETHSVLITHYEFTLNGNTELESTGESETTSGYAYANMLTKQEQKILAALKKEDEKTRQEMTTREQALIRMNEVIANAMGLYFIPVTSSVDGSTKYYFTNRPTLEESTLIYVFNSGGFAWSNKWEGDKTAWKYGITNEGNAFLNYLSLNKLDANYIEVESIVGKINESTGSSELSITADHIDVNGKSLSLTLQNYITDEDLNTTLASELKSYITSEELSLTLTSYATKDDLDGYAKASELDIYITSEELSATVSDYAKKEDGETNTFGYSLTSNGFILQSNNKTVMNVDESGLTINGTIDADSGIIGGFTITENCLYAGTLDFFNNSEESVEPSFTKQGSVLSSYGIQIRNINDGEVCQFWVNSLGQLSLQQGNVGSGVFLSFDFDGLIVHNGLKTSDNEFAGLGMQASSLIAYGHSTSGALSFPFLSVDANSQLLTVSGDILPRTNNQAFGSSLRKWGQGYFTDLYCNGNEVAAPHIQFSSSTSKAQKSSGTMLIDSTFSQVDTNYSVEIVKLGKFAIGTISYTGQIDADRWYRFRIRNLSIMCAQVSAFAISHADLGGYNYSARLVEYHAGEYIYVGSDNDIAQNGIEILFIGEYTDET